MGNTNTCMGVFEFNDQKKYIFSEIIGPLVESHTGLKFIYGLSYYEAVIPKMDLIHRLIEESKLVIIDISEKNPNVFMELGIAYVLKKPTVLICSEKNWQGKSHDSWNGTPPFDIQGREILIYSDENDLKVKLGKSISDALFNTTEITFSWISNKATSHVKSSSELTIDDNGSIWSTLGIGNYFSIYYHVTIDDSNTPPDRNPDVRLLFAHEKFSFPQIVSIFPWELSEIDTNKYECHIDYFPSNNQNGHTRIQQIPVGEKNINIIRDFDVSVSFCYPNMVFESSFFEDKITRLIVSLQDLMDRGYPVHLGKYIGFEARNCIATISNISVKEICIP